MRILISRMRDTVILTRDAQKGTGRLLESVKCHYYNLTFSTACSAQAAFLMGA